MTSPKVEYKHHENILEAYVAYPKEIKGKLPAVLIYHPWEGRNEFVEKIANEWAEKGYIGIALDNYGKGKIGTTVEEKSKLMTPLLENREFLAERLLAGFEAIKNLPHMDSSKIVAMGYCFGGLCALDLARNGVPLSGVISIHGLLGAPDYKYHFHTNIKVMAFTGYNDPMVKPELVNTFEEELNKANVDWQLVVYGKTKHAFTNPKAHDENLGLMYNFLAEKRCYQAIDNFIAECFK